MKIGSSRNINKNENYHHKSGQSGSPVVQLERCTAAWNAFDKKIGYVSKRRGVNYF